MAKFLGSLSGVAFGAIGVDRGLEFIATHPMKATPCSAHQALHHTVECTVAPFVVPALPVLGGLLVGAMWVGAGLVVAGALSRFSRALRV
jgi:carbon starvation protein CstA